MCNLCNNITDKVNQVSLEEFGAYLRKSGNGIDFVLDIDEGEVDWGEINFCPICGRKLGD